MAYTFNYSKISGKNEYEITGFAILPDLTDTVTIPGTYNNLPVTQLGTNCFVDCTTLGELVIPNSVKTATEGCLSGCVNIKRLQIPFVGEKEVARGKAYRYPFGWLFGHTAKSNCYLATQHFVGFLTVTAEYKTYIPKSLEYVYLTGEGCSYLTNYAFEDCGCIKEIRIGDAITYIDYHAFNFIGNNYGAAAIGGNVDGPGSDVLINGGNIIAESTGIGAAAIGAQNYNEIADQGDIQFGNQISTIEVKNLKQRAYVTAGAQRYFYERNPYVKIDAESFTEGIPYGGSPITSATTTLRSGVYYAAGDITCTHSITISGTKSNPTIIVLRQNSNLTVTGDANSAGIKLGANNKLVIWAERPDENNQLGQLNVVGGSGCAGIGGNGGAIEINGGAITVKAGSYNSPRSATEKLIFECKHLTGSSTEVIFSGYDGDSIGELHFKGTLSEYITGFWEPISDRTLPPTWLSHNLYLDTEVEAEAPTTELQLEDVNKIPKDTFNSCYALETVSFGEDVLEIDKRAFQKCAGITSVYLNSNITSIWSYAFDTCVNLAEITIPATVTTMGEGVFDDCTSLSIYLDFYSTPSTWDENWNIDHLPVYYKKSLEYALDASGTYYTCVGIGQYPGNDLNIPQQYADPNTHTILPVKAVGNNAFKNNKNLTKVYLADSIVSIGNSAFEGCSSLRSISLPKNSKYAVGESAFKDCTGISTGSSPLVISALSIGASAFNGCTSLTRIQLTNRSLGLTAGNEFANCTYLWNLEGAVREVGSTAFSNCRRMHQIVLSNTECIVREAAFDWLMFPYDRSIEYIVDFNGQVLEANAFSSCYIDTITLSKNLVSVGRNAFFAAPQISNVVFKGTLSQWCNINFANNDSNPLRKCEKFFLYDDEVTALDLSQVSVINNYAFYGLKCANITIGSSVTKIGREAFARNNVIETITIPTSVTVMGPLVFEYCTKLFITCLGVSKPRGWDNSWNGGRPCSWSKYLRNLTIFGSTDGKWEGKNIRQITYNNQLYIVKK